MQMSANMRKDNVMKKFIIAFLAIALTGAVFAAEANLSYERNPPATVMRDWTPLSLTIITPVALPWGVWEIDGLQVGGFNWAENMNGLQIGFFNTADITKGVQLGGINVTRQMYGLQIGFINVIQDNDVPFLPVINWHF